MKNNPEHDLKVIKVEDGIPRIQHLYFGEGGATGKKVSEAIEECARLLGAGKTKIDVKAGWYFICADVDWLFNSVHKVNGIEDIFKNPFPFPEAGVNSCRMEVMARIFSEKAYTIGHGKMYPIKGEPVSSNTLDKHLTSLGDWKRIVAFKFKAQK